MSVKTDYKLDSFANTYLDGIGWREEAAKLHIKYGQNEIQACSLMKKELLNYLCQKHGIDLATVDVTVDIEARRFIVVEKPRPPAQENE